MTEAQLREMFERLSQSLRDAGMEWLVAEASNDIRQGKPVVRVLSDDVVFSVPEPDALAKDDRLGSEPYSAREQFDLLAQATRRVVSHARLLAYWQQTFVESESRHGINLAEPEVGFAPTEPGQRPRFSVAITPAVDDSISALLANLAELARRTRE